MSFGSLLRRAGGGGHAPEDPTADFENVDVQHYLGYIWVAIVGIFTLYQVAFHLIRYVRTIVCLNNETQRYFSTPHAMFANFRKHCLDAPLSKTRHHREFKLSSAINIGTLPSRLQTFLLVGYFATNVGLAVWKVDFGKEYSTVASEIRNRTGVMAVINMIPLFLLAGRNNPIIKLTHISFDTMNLIHRWFGRIVVLEAITHTAAWVAGKVHTSKLASRTVTTVTIANMIFPEGWAAVQASITSKGSDFIWTGLMGTVAFTFILIQSPGALRHAYYETFLIGHIIGAAVAIAGVWIHLNGRHQQQMIYAVVAIWVFEVCAT